jgi:hypothetical protein
MQRIICSRPIGRALAASLRSAAAIAAAIAVALSTNIGPAISMDSTVPSEEPSTTSAQDLPLDAFGYLGGLLEARFFEPHSTTNDPRDEIRDAAGLYGVDLAMMMSIAKVESDFGPRVRTGSYKGLFQLSDFEFARYGDGSIWDARDDARAAAHLFLVQAEKFKGALGHYPDSAERYMVQHRDHGASL